MGAHAEGGIDAQSGGPQRDYVTQVKQSTAEGDQPPCLVWVQGQGQQHAVPLPLAHKLQWEVQEQLVCRVAVIHKLTHESTNDDLDPMSVADQQCWRPHGC